LADHIGRKWTIQIAAVVAMIGGALAAGSVHIAMLIVVRIFQGAGLGALATLTPVYLVESSTAAKRGMLTGLHGFFLVSGYNISSWVGFGCYFAKNLTFGWRGPIAFTCIPALLLTIGKSSLPRFEISHQSILTGFHHCRLLLRSRDTTLPPHAW
jgi:MFS family permease